MAQRNTKSKAGGKRRTSTRSVNTAGTSRPVRSSSKKRGGSSAGDSPLFPNSAERRDNRPGRKKGTVLPAAGDVEVSIDRRRAERRGQVALPANQVAEGTPPLERRKKVNRRRQIDPTTCERDYTDQEVEFMNALDEYKRRSGRMFPTCSEVLEVIRALGYVKLSAAELGSRPEASASEGSAKPMPDGWTEDATDLSYDDASTTTAREPELAY